MHQSRHYLVLMFLLLVPTTLLNKPMKIIGLVPVRNEATLISQCLRSLALYTDAIVVLDDASDDNTLEIIKSLVVECKIEKILHKVVWIRDEPDDKTALLQAGRAIGGTHFIVIDADEMLSASCNHNNQLRRYIAQLNPGDRLCLRFYELWGNIAHYREEKPKHIACIFCDDGSASYNFSTFIHTSRHPFFTQGTHLFIGNNDDCALLHFDCINLQQYAIKQLWYRYLEHIRDPEKPIDEINTFYHAEYLQKELPLYPTKSAWFAYPFFDESIFSRIHCWREKQIKQWIDLHGEHFFAGINGLEFIISQS